jgi:hypothetical protein
VRLPVLHPAARLMFTEEQLKASVFAFVAELSARSGVDIDPEEVWEELQHRMVT